MIVLNQNATNNVYLTLSESVTLTAATVYFLFRFVDETTKDEVLFIASDVSTNTIRYNLFNITLTASTASNIDYTNGIISLSPFGKWTYEVYNQLSSTNLDLNNASGPIEKGIVTVNALSTINVDGIVNEYTGMTETYNYYQPGQ
jgi:hypothetical protein